MDNTETNRAQQAKDFYNIAKVAMEANNCNEIMVWGLTDDMTWRNNRNPLLYNGDLTPKDAYYGMHAGVRIGAKEVTTDIDYNPIIKSNVDNGKAIYNLQGQRLTNTPTKGS